MTQASHSSNPTIANPLGTDGFEFVMFSGPDPDGLSALFEKMGRSISRLSPS